MLVICRLHITALEDTNMHVDWKIVMRCIVFTYVVAGHVLQHY